MAKKPLSVSIQDPDIPKRRFYLKTQEKAKELRKYIAQGKSLMACRAIMKIPNHEEWGNLLLCLQHGDGKKVPKEIVYLKYCAQMETELERIDDIADRCIEGLVKMGMDGKVKLADDLTTEAQLSGKRIGIYKSIVVMGQSLGIIDKAAEKIEGQFTLVAMLKSEIARKIIDVDVKVGGKGNGNGKALEH